MTKKIENELTKTHRGFFIDSEKNRIKNILNLVNEKYKTKYVLVAMTEKYLSNFYIKDEHGNYNSFFARTPEEDNNIFLEQLINKWCDGYDILFTAHNLDYEYSYIRYNTNFLQKLVAKSENYNIIAENVSNIKCIEFEHENGAKFIIKDTYLMTNKKIAKLGKEFNLPKLEYNYTTFRKASSDLENYDYKYNERDNVIAMKAIEQLQQQVDSYKDITKLPISATHHAKNICKNNPDVNKKVNKRKLDQTHKAFSYLYNMPTLELYQYFFNASAGGLIFVNPKYTRRFLPNTKSFDIKSAHPSQFYNKRFPQGNTTEEINPEGLLDLFKSYMQKMKKEPVKFYNNFNPIKDYLMLVEFTNLSANVLPHDNIILSLGSGKQISGNRESVITNRLAINVEGKTINGKTVKSKKYTKWLYGIDLIYHLSFYQAEEIKILKCFKYKMVPCSQYIISKADYYSSKKELYKKFKNYAKTHNFKETQKYIIENGAEEYTIKGLDESDYQSFLENELLRIKGIFNGLFGQEYQNLLHDYERFTKDYDIEVNSDIEPDYQKILSKTNVHYCTGAYTAAWTRFELACMIWHTINNGGTCLYGATDSIKCINTNQEIFNNFYQKQNNKWNSHNVFNFGSVDFDGEYNLFYIPETLKNIAIKNIDGKIHLDFTISGFKADIYFYDTIKKFEGKEYTTKNINKLTNEIDLMMQPQIIPAELTGKTIRNRKFAGVTTNLNQINFGALEPIEYMLLGG